MSQIVLFAIVGGIFIFSFTIPLFHANKQIQTKYRRAENVKLKTRIALIVVGAILAPLLVEFTFIFITLAVGGGTWALSQSLRALETPIFHFIIYPIVGASVGYLIGKRRNRKYQ
jgi:formate/nitrite transporter FocA (FNT family)